jgi:hypothetical protein
MLVGEAVDTCSELWPRILDDEASRRGARTQRDQLSPVLRLLMWSLKNDVVDARARATIQHWLSCLSRTLVVRSRNLSTPLQL